MSDYIIHQNEKTSKDFDSENQKIHQMAEDAAKTRPNSMGSMLKQPSEVFRPGQNDARTK